MWADSENGRKISKCEAQAGNGHYISRNTVLCGCYYSKQSDILDSVHEYKVILQVILILTYRLIEDTVLCGCYYSKQSDILDSVHEYKVRF